MTMSDAEQAVQQLLLALTDELHVAISNNQVDDAKEATQVLKTGLDFATYLKFRRQVGRPVHTVDDDAPGGQ